jgi:probable rRNA maturation factor
MSPSEHSSEPPRSADWFLNRQRCVQFDRRGLIAFASGLRRELAGGREFAVCVASDAALRRANLEFRGKAEVTDVLSFPECEGPDLGGVLISAPQARRQARELGHSFDAELQILVLHGLLHLLGYDHERDGGKMRRLESRWRRRLQLPSSLIERAQEKRGGQTATVAKRRRSGKR